MTNPLQLSEMSTEEKLRAMEEIWADLVRGPASVPVPAWHGQELEARRQRVDEGTAGFSNWSDAKSRVMDRKG
jgi:hypothetical protein